MLLIALTILAPTWYGPATVNQALPTTGNPFSPTENDMHVVFTGNGKEIDRLAYYAKGEWHATLSTNKGGNYTARFILNGKPIGSPVTVPLQPAKDGDFVKLDKTRFKLTSGKPFIPFGHDFGWQNGADATYEKQLKDMHDAGLNWSRIWADSWDSKNPYYPPDKTAAPKLESMYEPALDRWDMVVDQCEKNDIKFQFVLFHHGLFSTTTDANWSGHPWNTKNGGFLADPTDFFINPECKKLTKQWLRYAVARWGHSPSIMAWELFNEVQWVDACKLHPERIPDVVAWHKEMGDYMRSIDPYHHLVTSSSGESLDARVFSTMDYLQPHTYPPSVYGAVLGSPVPKDKPLFFGEFGPGPGSTAKMGIRDGFWGGLLSGQAGPAQYWYWDQVYRQNLYPEFARCAAVLKASGFAENPDAKPAPITVTGGVPSDLTLRPGRGWAPSKKFTYNLPADVSTGALPLLSGYIQGAKGNNRATMMPEPLRFRFTARAAGEAHIRLGQSSKGGANVVVLLNGKQVLTKDYPNADRETRIREDIPVPFDAGENEITLDNQGSDRFTLDSISLPGIGTGVSAVALGSSRYCLARLTWSSLVDSASLSMPGLRDGSYELTQFDLEKGTKKSRRVSVKGGVLKGYVPWALDEGLLIQS